MKRQLSRIEREVILSRIAAKDVTLILGDGVNHITLDRDQWAFSSSCLEILKLPSGLSPVSSVTVMINLQGKVFLFRTKKILEKTKLLLHIPSDIYTQYADHDDFVIPSGVLQSKNWTVDLSYPVYLKDLLASFRIPTFDPDSVIASVSSEIRDLVFMNSPFSGKNEPLTQDTQIHTHGGTEKFTEVSATAAAAAAAAAAFCSTGDTSDSLITESSRPWYLLHVDHQLVLIARYSGAMCAPEETVLTLTFKNRTIRSSLVQTGFIRTDNSIVVLYHQSALAEEDKRFLYERCFGRTYG